MHGVPQDIASIMTIPKGSGQSIGNNSARALPRKSHFCGFTDFAYKLDIAAREQRLDVRFEIVSIHAIDFCGDA
jgi:hypothetical protein